MTFSLKKLKPQIIDVRIQGAGEDIVIPLRPLTYVEWNNAAIGVEIPRAPMVRKMSNGKNQDVEDSNDPKFQEAFINAHNTINFRRLAVALEGGGAKELKGKSLDEQVELLREMDTGITNALIEFLSRAARSKRAERFQGQSVSANGHADMQSAKVVAESISGTE